MSTLSLRLPDSIHERIRELARQDGVSINQFISMAAAEKVAAILTVEYLENRAKNGDKERFIAALERVRDAPPLPGDEIDS